MTPLDFSPDEFAFENRKLTIEDLREEITNESEESPVIDIISAIVLSYSHVYSMYLSIMLYLYHIFTLFPHATETSYPLSMHTS